MTKWSVQILESGVGSADFVELPSLWKEVKGVVLHFHEVRTKGVVFRKREER